jgi:hypothetical protein
MNQITIIGIAAHRHTDERWSNFYQIAAYISIVRTFTPAPVQFISDSDTQRNQDRPNFRSAAFTLIASVQVLLRCIQCLCDDHDKCLNLFFQQGLNGNGRIRAAWLKSP